MRRAIESAFATGRMVGEENLTIENGGQVVNLLVEPMTKIRKAGRHGGGLSRRPASRATARQGEVASWFHDVEALRQELSTLQVRYQATSDELESQLENMKSVTEEYQSVNEELQSSNEELETAKEEMQSVNEELQTINSELHGKNDLLMPPTTTSRICSTARRLQLFLSMTICSIQEFHAGGDGGILLARRRPWPSDNGYRLAAFLR